MVTTTTKENLEQQQVPKQTTPATNGLKSEHEDQTITRSRKTTTMSEAATNENKKQQQTKQLTKIRTRKQTKEPQVPKQQNLKALLQRMKEQQKPKEQQQPQNETKPQNKQQQKPNKNENNKNTTTRICSKNITQK